MLQSQKLQHISHATNTICTKQVNNNYNINNNNNHDHGQKYQQKLVIITKESRSETIMVVFSSAGKIRIFNPDLLAFCGHCQSRTHICSSIAHNHSLILKASKPLEVIIKMEKKSKIIKKSNTLSYTIQKQRTQKM